MAVSWLSDLFKRRCICKLGRRLGYIGICHPDTVIKLRKKVFFFASNQALVEVIREHHHHHHFLDILTEVTKRVVERQNREHNIECPVQVPAPMHTLTKHLYL